MPGDWFERTRLDFKKLNGDAFFVAPATILDPAVSFVPYRITYPIGELSNNRVNYDAAVNAMGGDTKRTKIMVAAERKNN